MRLLPLAVGPGGTRPRRVAVPDGRCSRPAAELAVWPAARPVEFPRGPGRVRLSFLVGCRSRLVAGSRFEVCWAPICSDSYH